jgi:biotin operon repressor
VRTATAPAADCKTSVDVILIPKQLRLEWTDVLALDAELSHVAFRVACVIGSHFNRHRGDTYISQKTIARIMGVSERTVWTATEELERRGYLIIRRRELGVRATDGRRVCGGKGVANTYLPAFKRSQVSTIKPGLKLAARCDLLWEQRSKSSARKVAADCDPTLASPSEKNPSHARAPAVLAHALGEAGDLLRSRLGADLFASWFGQVKVEHITDGTLTLSAPTKFMRNWITTNYLHDVLACWKRGQPTIERVEIAVRPSS